MKEILAFPQLGDYQYPIRRLLQDMTKKEVLIVPPITKKQLN